jgi:glutamate dehydrogenase
MPTHLDDARTEVIEEAAEAGERHGLHADELRSFLSRYFRHVADEDLCARDPVDVAGCALSHRQLASQRADGTANVRVYTPTVDEHGWSTGPSSRSSSTTCRSSWTR